jgi:hypothetical protein
VLHKSNVVLLLCLIEYYMESRKAKYIFPQLLLVTVVNLYIPLSVDAILEYYRTLSLYWELCLVHVVRHVIIEISHQYKSCARRDSCTNNISSNKGWTWGELHVCVYFQSHFTNIQYCLLCFSSLLWWMEYEESFRNFQGNCILLHIVEHHFHFVLSQS